MSEPRASRPASGAPVRAAVAALAVVWLARASQGAASPPSSCHFDAVERIVAVGDVHGAYDRLVDILHAAGVLDAGQHWAGGKAHLVQLGDIVDRGPDSRKALDLLKRLEMEAPQAGGAAHVLLGNHEVMRMLDDLRYVAPGEYDAFATPAAAGDPADGARLAAPNPLIKPPPPGLAEMQAAFSRQGEYGRWLRTLDVVVRINGILFVHGGISPAFAPLPCETINKTVRRELTDDFEKTRDAPLGSFVTRDDGPLWYRGLAEEPDSFVRQVEGVLDRQHARQMVIAHTVTPDSRIRVRFGGKVFLTDTGAQPAYVPNGRASALDIRNGTFTAIYLDRRDVLEGGRKTKLEP